MLPQPSAGNALQGNFFKVLLVDIINAQHPLVKLGQAIDWSHLTEVLGELFCEDNGRPAKPVRLMVGLHYLKYTYDLSDEGVLAGWVENPYWQHFCGEQYFEHRLPVESSSLTVWRKRMSETGVEEMLAETIRTGMSQKLIRKSEVERVNVDTTVQEKAVRFPTDARLYDRMRERLVRQARSEGVELRQSYCRVSKRALRKQSGYARARQSKRAARQTRKLRTILGRVLRDIIRKHPAPSPVLQQELAKAERLLAQQRNGKHKLYSIHEPQVECIAKGKAHKRYEFGCKVGFTTSAKGNWILGAQAFPGNPYDGHTLAASLSQTERLTGVKLKQAAVDMGYRGHKYEGECKVLIANRYRKKIPKAVRYWWKRRSAIEPVIGHAKQEHRLSRNRLKGVEGDRINAVLSACGFNMRKLLRQFSFLPKIWRWLEALLARQQAFFTQRRPHALLFAA